MNIKRSIILVAVTLLVAAVILRPLAYTPAAAPPASQPAGANPDRTFPHIRIDNKKRFIDLDATIVMREGEWIELLACMPRSREHEAILTIAATPSHIHLALLMLGLEPGAPMTSKRVGDKLVVTPPRGPKVAVSIITRHKGKVIEIKANQWIVNQKTDKPLSDNIWLFTGSGITKWQGRQVYRADMGGSIISMVNFGDEVLARPTKLTSHNDEAMWGIATKVIPPLDTQLRIRLRPVPKPATSQPATSQPAASQPATSQPATSQPAPQSASPSASP